MEKQRSQRKSSEFGSLRRRKKKKERKESSEIHVRKASLDKISERKNKKYER